MFFFFFLNSNTHHSRRDDEDGVKSEGEGEKDEEVDEEKLEDVLDDHILDHSPEIVNDADASSERHSVQPADAHSSWEDEIHVRVAENTVQVN